MKRVHIGVVEEALTGGAKGSFNEEVLDRLVTEESGTLSWRNVSFACQPFCLCFSGRYIVIAVSYLERLFTAKTLAQPSFVFTVGLFMVRSEELFTHCDRIFTE